MVSNFIYLRSIDHRRLAVYYKCTKTERGLRIKAMGRAMCTYMALKQKSQMDIRRHAPTIQLRALLIAFLWVCSPATASTIFVFPITTLALPFYNAQSYGWLPDGTDHSTQALALLSAVSAAGGGTIYFPPAGNASCYRADSQLLIPQTAQNKGNGSQPVQANFRLTGGGGGAEWAPVSPYSGPGATCLISGISPGHAEHQNPETRAWHSGH